jgi:hypothetical protein
MLCLKGALERKEGMKDTKKVPGFTWHFFKDRSIKKLFQR